MRNTTFTMNIKGKDFRFYNGTHEVYGKNAVAAEDIKTGEIYVIKDNGTYANKSAARKSLIKYLERYGISEEVFKEEQEEEKNGMINEDFKDEDKLVTFFEYFGEAVDEGYFDDDDDEIKEENPISEEEVVKVINDVIYRNLPKYVQKAIDYCDYVDGVYRIHVNTEFGSREIEADKWAEASSIVKSYCKTGEM